MEKLSAEFKVGIFLIIVLAVLSFMTFKVGDFNWFRKKGYIVHAHFTDISGLDKNTKIRIAGVNAGSVEKIDLVEGEARLTLRIDPEVVLYSDALASVKSTGILGDKYLAIKTGSTEPVLKNGDTITRVQDALDLNEAIRKLSTISESIARFTTNLNEVFGTPESKEELKAVLRNLKSMTQKLDTAVSENDGRLRETLDNINRLAKSLQTVVDENSGPLKETMANMKDFTGTLKKDGPELVKNINETTKSLKNISSQIESGEGTLGKLVKDDKLYSSLDKAAEGLNRTLSSVERFRTFLTFQGEYLTGVSEYKGKGHFSLTLQPKPDKYYILGIVSDPLGKPTYTKTYTTVDGVTTYTEEKTYKRRIEFTAQFAKRFDNTAVRIGITENTLAMGIDQFFFKDKLRIVSDAWDFGHDEFESRNPHVTVGAEYFFYKRLFLSGGYDNIFNAKTGGPYFGAGVRFEDEDFKYLLGTVPRVQ
ncbi:MAG: MlaD family protein [bacterium]